jgi:hypothetical protein
MRLVFGRIPARTLVALVASALLSFLLPLQAQAQCQDHCDAPGSDIAGTVTGPGGSPVTGTVSVFDYSNPAVQQLEACLIAKKGQLYSMTMCPMPWDARVVWAPTNGGAGGVYDIKDTNGKGVQAGRYLILVINEGFEGNDGVSGLAVGTWQSQVLNISADLLLHIRLTPY